MDKIERYMIESSIILVCLLFSIFGVKCAHDRAREAEEASQTAHREAKELRAMLEHAQKENARTREIMAKYDEVLMQAHVAVEEAISRTNERLEQIKSIDPDWRLEPVPVGVCDLFADYTDRDSTGATTTDSVAPMCEATDLSNQDK